MRIRARIVIPLACVAMTMVLACGWLWTRGGVSPALPEPNAYDDFLSAAGNLKGVTYAYADFTPDEARRFVERNRASFEKYRQGLGLECLVPVEYSVEWLRGSTEDMARIKRLVHSVLTEARVAADQGQKEVAFERHMDALRFVYQIPRGGLWSHYRAAQGFKALVFQSIRAVLPDLSAAEREKMIELLDRLENEEESWRTLALRERALQRETSGSSSVRLLQGMFRLRTLYPEAIILKPSIEAFRSTVTQFRDSVAAGSGE